ncbi:NAD(P)/FAD-dependent oxidoreductase [Leifsonia sp. NPDC056665]|uniref:NAD(P)/FAD-dependent oxidoreductase n=1 Tax=Leifsonia sp. NPDC056665 TaxID=3345901 RepID=UPI0036A61DC1
MSENILTPTVLIIGGGPSGLRAAAELGPRVEGQVLVVERESVAGGIPRHSDHPGYGIRDMGKFISGPKYAHILRQRASKAGAKIMVNTMVTDWAGDLAVNATSPQGRITIQARVVILATGARERPRPARLIPGDRGHGVYTTGNLQNVVHLKHNKVGKRAVIVGSELVSWSAALTLKHVGCRTVLMTTEYPKPDAYFFFSKPGKIFFNTKIATRTKVTRIIGKPEVQAIEIENLDTGKRDLIECDTVILTGDWIPDNELVRSAGLPVDPSNRAPVVDETLQTTRPGLFAIGNMLHPVDTADIAALDGAAVADHVLRYLAGVAPHRSPLDVGTEAPLRWVSPSRVNLNGSEPPRGRLLLWTDRFVAFPKVVLKQQGSVVARKRLWWPAAPGRVFRVPSSILHGVDRRRGRITVALER